jgi:hypothetical protein
MEVPISINEIIKRQQLKRNVDPQNKKATNESSNDKDSVDKKPK